MTISKISLTNFSGKPSESNEPSLIVNRELLWSDHLTAYEDFTKMKQKKTMSALPCVCVQRYLTISRVYHKCGSMCKDEQNRLSES